MNHPAPPPLKSDIPPSVPCEDISARPAWTYFKAVAWFLPALFFMTFALLFLVPKFKKISDDVVGRPLPLAAQILTGGSAAINKSIAWAPGLVVGLLVLFELKASARTKRRWRGVLAGLIPWTLNLVSLALLTSLCLQPALLLPLLTSRERAYREFLTETGQLEAAQARLSEKYRFPSQWDRTPEGRTNSPPPLADPSPEGQ